MAYVIAEPCIGTKDTACVDVCPVDCIHTGGVLGADTRLGNHVSHSASPLFMRWPQPWQAYPAQSLASGSPETSTLLVYPAAPAFSTLALVPTAALRLASSWQP